MKSNLATIHGRLETILEHLEHIPDTQDVTPELCHEDPDSPLSQLGHHWLQFWSISYPQVRNERNLARDEAKQLRVNLEAAMKESNAYKREKSDLEVQIGQLKKEMEKVHLMLIKHAGQFDGSVGAEGDAGKNGEISPDLSSSDGLKRGGMMHRDSANREDGLVSRRGFLWKKGLILLVLFTVNLKSILFFNGGCCFKDDKAVLSCSFRLRAIFLPRRKWTF